MNFKKAVVVFATVFAMMGTMAACSAQGTDANATAKNTSVLETQPQTTEKNTEPSSEPQTTESAKTTTKKETTSAKATTKKSTTKKADAKKTTTKKQTTAVTTTKAPEIKINLKKNGNAECSSSNVTIAPPGTFGTEGTVYIEKGGDYIITSSTDVWHGQIIIKLPNTESANVRIENVNITSTKANVIKILDTSITTERSFIEAEAPTSSTGIDTDNALQDEMKQVSKFEKAPNVDLSFPTGTTSTFSTGANAISGVIYNESKLTIRGNGAVNINATANRNNALCSTKSVTFKNVKATLTTANNTVTSSLSSARGIFTYSKVYVESGSLIIRSNGDGIRCEEFNSLGGTTDIKSSACDGIDSDDAINITAGSVKAIATEKSCLKVRRVNNQELINGGNKTVKAEDGITKATHTFKIDGGTVIGESKNITTVQTSKQASITCRSVKAANTTEAKKALFFGITGPGVSVKSENAVIKYFYSSPSVNPAKEYTVSGAAVTHSGSESQKTYPSQTVLFKDAKGNATNVGNARIVANQ